MQRNIFRTIAATAAIGVFAGTRPDDGKVTPPATRHSTQRFVENRGQFPAQVKFRAEYGMASMFAESDGITWSMLEADAGERMHDMFHGGAVEKSAFQLRGHAWRMRFVDANGKPAITSFDRSTTYLNYFLGNDPRKWASNVGVFGQVLYEDVWNGIDLRLHSDKGGFKYDVLLDAGADVSNVRFAYEGLDALALDVDGRLALRTSVSELLEMAPVAWYADGRKEAVQCSFTLKDGTVGFAFASGTDTQRPIVIDPLLVASTLSGTGDLGMTQNFGHSATYDNLGNIYTGAHCFGQGYPVTTGAFQTIYGGGGGDIAISKLNPDGSDLIWATYFGGNGDDQPSSLVVDGSGNLSVLGITHSTDYPCSGTAFDNTYGGGSFVPDLVISKVDVSGGMLIGSTYVGGTGNDAANGTKGEILTDANGRILVAAASDSPDFPTTAGAFQSTLGGNTDAVAFRLSADLSAMDWSTYIGGNGIDVGLGLEIASTGDVYVCGSTGSTDFPVTAGAYQAVLQGGMEDGFVVRLSGTGSNMLSGTFIGSTGDFEVASFIELDNDGDVFVYGSMSVIPIVPAGSYATGGTMYVAQLQPDLSALITSNSISMPGGWGGADWQPTAFLVDNCGRIYISGFGLAVGPPLTPDALQTSGGFYLAAFEDDMASMLFGTYYGGGGDHVDGGTSRFDKLGIVYQGVCSGGGFPTTADAWSNTQPAGWDMAVFKIDFQLSGVAVNVAASATTGCAPTTITFEALGVYDNVQWDFGDGGTGVDDSLTYVFDDPGTYTVTLIGFDPLSCNLSDTAMITVVISDPVPVEPVFTVSQAGGCEPYTVVTVNSTTGPNNIYLWDMGDGTTYTSVNATHAYAGPGTYTITLTVTDNTCGTTASSSQDITVTEPVAIEALFNAVQVDQCSGLSVSTINLSTGPSGLVYTWSMGDGTTLTGNTVNHTYAEVGTYTITLTAYDPLCDEDDDFTVDVNVQPSPLVDQGILVPNIFSPNQDGLNDAFFPIPGAEDNVILKVWDRWGMKMFETTGQYKPWNGRTPGNKPVPDGVYFFILEYSIPCTGSRIEGKEEGYVHVVGSTM